MRPIRLIGPILIVVLVTALAYGNIFQNSFVIDDQYFIVEKSANPVSQQGVFRPIRSLLYTTYFQIFGTSNPAGYHLHSLVVHLASTVLVYLVIKSLIRNLALEISNLPLIAALLFGLHPIHTESITYIAASMEMTGVVFFLASFYTYLLNKKFLPVIFAFLAFFTYEMTLTLPLLILLYESVFGVRSVISTTLSSRLSSVIPTRFAGASARRAERTREWRDLLGSKDPSTSLRSARDDNRVGMTEVVRMTRKIWPYFGILFLYLVTRFTTGVGLARGDYLAFSPYHTFLTMTKMVVKYIWLLIWPVNLSHNHTILPGFEAFMTPYSDQAAILAQSIFDPEILFSIGLIGLICLIGLKLVKKHPLISFGIGWIFISLLPVLYIFPQGTAFAEKYLYIPSIGFVMVMSFLFVKLAKFDQLDKWAVTGVIAIALLYAVRTTTRNTDWRSPITLWEHEIQIHPRSELAYYNLGIYYTRNGQREKAVESYKKALELKPQFWQAENNLRNLLK